MATKATGKKAASDKQAETSDGPLLDLNNAAVKKMIKDAKKRGYVTYEELNKILCEEIIFRIRSNEKDFYIH